MSRVGLIYPNIENYLYTFQLRELESMLTTFNVYDKKFYFGGEFCAETLIPEVYPTRLDIFVSIESETDWNKLPDYFDVELGNLIGPLSVFNYTDKLNFQYRIVFVKRTDLCKRDFILDLKMLLNVTPIYDVKNKKYEF